MYDENAEFSLTWSPPRYPRYAADDTGAWRAVLEDDVPVGLVWVNDNSSGAGVLWVDQTDSIEKLRTHFKNAFEAGTPAQYAYNAAELLPGVKLADSQQGPLAGLDDELNEMSEE